MEAKYIKPIDTIRASNYFDLLVSAIAGDTELYYAVKNDTEVCFDFIEEHVCPETELQQISVEENAVIQCYPKGELILLSTEALEELALNREISEQKLILVYTPPEQNRQNYKINSSGRLSPIFLEDIYVDTRKMGGIGRDEQSDPSPHVTAIRAAFAALSTKARNQQILNWIEKQVKDGNSTQYPFVEDLKFTSSDISPYSITLQSATMFTYLGKVVTKQRFQDICSQERRRK